MIVSNNPIEKTRIAWVDTAKFICIIAVIAEHAACMTKITDAINAPFYLNGFFFLAGYVYRHEEGFSGFALKKIRQLFIPWLFFSLFAIFTAYYFSFNEQTELKKALLFNFLQIREKGDGMWFVAALFIAFFPFYFIIKQYLRSSVKKKTTITFLSLLSLSVISSLFSRGALNNSVVALPWHIEYIFRIDFLMFSGFILREKWEVLFDRFNSRKNRVILAVFYFGLVVLIWVLETVIQPYRSTVFYRYFSSFIGLLLLISVSKAIKPNRMFSFIGRNTVSYYGLHGKLLSIVNRLSVFAFPQYYYALCSYSDKHVITSLAEVNGGVMTAATVLSYLIAVIVAVALIIPAYIIERYFPFIAGKTKKH